MRIDIHAKLRASAAGPTATTHHSLEHRLQQLAERWRRIEADVQALGATGVLQHHRLADAGRVVNGAAAAPPAALDPDPRDTPEVARLRALCRTLPLHSAVFKWVPPEYYSRPLQWRRDILAAPSIHFLCKTIVMENTHCVYDDCRDRNNSRFYCVVFQYTQRFDAEKLMRFVRSRNDGLGKKKFNFRLADPALSQQLTGFGHNGVVPFGTATDLPIILSDRIAQLSPAHFWMGGGHADCKVRVDLDDFAQAFEPLIADVTNPMSEEELAAVRD